jgi:hypothetical protein
VHCHEYGVDASRKRIRRHDHLPSPLAVPGGRSANAMQKATAPPCQVFAGVRVFAAAEEGKTGDCSVPHPDGGMVPGEFESSDPRSQEIPPLGGAVQNYTHLHGDPSRDLRGRLEECATSAVVRKR